MRLNEMSKQNKDFKSTSSLMERKVDELAEENGVLSSQVMTCAKFPSVKCLFCLLTYKGISNTREILMSLFGSNCNSFTLHAVTCQC